MEIILLAITVLPVIIIGNYVYKKDRNSESHKLLLKLFLGGMSSGIMVLLVSEIFNLFPFFLTPIEELNLFQLFIYVLIKIAFIEELCKFIFTYFISYNNVEFDEAIDGILYGVFVALGFAFLENLFYVFGYGFSTGLLRAITAVPMHASAGIIMGYYFGLSKMSKYNNKLSLEKKYLVLSLLIPILLHCVYDFLAFSGNQLFVILFYILIVIMYVISFIKINKFFRINTKMKYKDNYCPNCGVKVNGNYCTNCGRKHE